MDVLFGTTTHRFKVEVSHLFCYSFIGILLMVQLQLFNGAHFAAVQKLSPSGERGMEVRFHMPLFVFYKEIVVLANTSMKENVVKEETRALVKEDIIELCKKYGIKSDDVVNVIESEEMRKYEKELRDNVAENSHLVGKTYRKKVDLFSKMYRYYKVVSERSDYGGSVSCLTFDETPHWRFASQVHKLHRKGDGILGTFNFNPIWVECIRVKNALGQKALESMEEIDAALYDAKMDNLVAEIKKMKWEVDH